MLQGQLSFFGCNLALWLKLILGQQCKCVFKIAAATSGFDAVKPSFVVAQTTFTMGYSTAFDMLCLHTLLLLSGLFMSLDVHFANSVNVISN